VFGACEELDLPFECAHGHAVFGGQHHEGSNAESRWKLLILPDATGVEALAENFESTDPPHDTCQVAEEDVAGLDSTEGGTLAVSEARDRRPGLAELLPGSSREQVQPVVHGPVHLLLGARVVGSIMSRFNEDVKRSGKRI
jgi:hypothetical protein